MRLTITAALLASLALCGCSAAAAAENVDGACNLSERIEQYATAKAAYFDAESEQNAARAANAAIAEQRAAEAEQAAQIEAESVYEYSPTCTAEYYAPTYAPSYSTSSDGLTAQSGVNYHDGRMETYYSSNVLYHHDTASWTLDDEGFYRTDEGYYVVAASDMEQGTTFETSKGTAQVLDSGCAGGVTDFYVAW